MALTGVTRRRVYRACLGTGRLGAPPRALAAPHAGAFVAAGHRRRGKPLLGLFGGVLGAGVAWALCALLGSLGGAALSLSWQTAGIAALAAALLSWLSGRLGASGVRK